MENTNAMLKITSKDILSDIKNETITVEELSFHLMRNYSVADIADSLAECLLEREIKEPQVPKIRITKEQFDAFVSVKGYKDYVNDNAVRTEKRGRPRKEKDE